MRRHVVAAVLSLAGLAAGAESARAQSATINLAGVQLRNATNVNRDSLPQTIQPAARYHIVTSGTVHGSTFSLLGLLFPTPTPLATVLETLSPGSSAFLDQTAINPTSPPTHPFAPAPVTQSGTQVVLGTTVTFAATIATGIGANNAAFFSLSNVTLTPSSVGYLIFDTGSVVVTRIPCPTDTDGNHVLEPSDIAGFVNVWFTSLSAGTLAGDYDLDGTVAPADIALFVSDWFAALSGGGCPS